ncbi:MAG: phosphate ABC transporter substrate-binding protein PstS [Propionibacteriaceae bacterium]
MPKKHQIQATAALFVSAFFLSSCQTPAPIATSTSQPSTQQTATPKSTVLSCPTGTIFGEGSSAQKIALDSLISSYAGICDHHSDITYASYSSGSGVKSFSTSLVHFAGLDSPLNTKTDGDGLIEAEAARQRCAQNPAWAIPIFLSPIAFVYHLDGVSNLTLTPAVISKIFSGQITNWDDPEVKSLNPSSQLPNQKIVPIYRSDDSGTSENVAAFLHSTSPELWSHSPERRWAGNVGVGKHQSTGVIDAVTTTSAAIGYVEWSYAKKSSISVAALDVGKGSVQLTSASAELATKSVTLTENSYQLTLDFPYTNVEAGSYPVLMGNYILACSQGGITVDETQLLKDFLSHIAAPDSQENLTDLGYVQLSKSWQAKVKTTIDAIR